MVVRLCFLGIKSLRLGGSSAMIELKSQQPVLAPIRFGALGYGASESDGDSPCVSESASPSKSPLLLSLLEGRQVWKSSPLSCSFLSNSVLCGGKGYCGREVLGSVVCTYACCSSGTRSWGNNTAPETTSAVLPSGNRRLTLSSDVRGLT